MSWILFVLGVAGFIIRCNSVKCYIIGGDQASKDQFPYQASLFSRLTLYHFCSGGVISDRYILTAAHCICKDIDFNEVEIHVGSNNLYQGGTNILPESHICHPKYKSTRRVHDLALIRLKDALVFSPSIQPIALSRTSVPNGARVLVSGWGMTNFKLGTLPSELVHVYLNTISKKECLRFNGPAELGGFQFCTMMVKEQKGTCKGDSGAPVVFEGKLVGVVSYGKPCVDGEADVHTDVTSYLPWIAGIVSPNSTTIQKPVTAKNIFRRIKNQLRKAFRFRFRKRFNENGTITF